MLILASFRRGKDRKKRKSRRRKYLESALEGAGLGVVVVPTVLGAKQSLNSINAGKNMGQSVGKTYLQVV